MKQQIHWRLQHLTGNPLHLLIIYDQEIIELLSQSNISMHVAAALSIFHIW